ncbi:hypothetical protein B0J11DRAFT_525573 [Dendryphion nanum]|uniref:Uncharacterized protein n=1 Tax=Dendryphion nanum TaxID=256645 RepID=A0A9P9E0B2_9PLEO|nr:hypothetical protein B0J11DRAFT_525573 [Dendryphion nanum]
MKKEALRELIFPYVWWPLLAVGTHLSDFLAMKCCERFSRKVGPGFVCGVGWLGGNYSLSAGVFPDWYWCGLQVRGRIPT